MIVAGQQSRNGGHHARQRSLRASNRAGTVTIAWRRARRRHLARHPARCSAADSTSRSDPDTAISSRPYFTRPSIQESRYAHRGPAQFGRRCCRRFAPSPRPIQVGDIAVPRSRRSCAAAKRRLPYGYVMRELRVVPALSLTVAPTTAVVPLAAARKQVAHHRRRPEQPRRGQRRAALALRLPQGWKAEPAQAPFAFARAGERALVSLHRHDARDREPGLRRCERSRPSMGATTREGFEELDFRDLETRYLYRAFHHCRARHRRDDRARA